VIGNSAGKEHRLIVVPEPGPDPVLAAAPDAVMTIDERGRVCELNAAAESMFGYSREQALGRAVAELVIPPPSTVRWTDVFRDVSRAYRALLLRHPHAIPLLAALPLTDPAAARAAGSVMALLRAAGFDAESALRTLATITSYVVGIAQWEVGTAPLRAEGRDVTLPPDADPYLVELLPQLAEDDCDGTFEFGLDVIVRGLETRP